MNCNVLLLLRVYLCCGLFVFVQMKIKKNKKQQLTPQRRPQELELFSSYIILPGQQIYIMNEFSVPSIYHAYTYIIVRQIWWLNLI